MKPKFAARLRRRSSVDTYSLISTDDDNLVKTLYQGPKKCQCCNNWVDKLPPQCNLEVVEEEDDEDDEDSGPPLIIRQGIRHDADGKGDLWTYSIEVRNALVREILVDVFKGMDSLQPNIRYLTLYAPFHPFYWRWDRFVQTVDETKDSNAKAILLKLKYIVWAELYGAFNVQKELVSKGLITWEYLWTIFEPGEIIYSKSRERHRFRYLEWGEYSGDARKYNLHLLSVSDNGKSMGLEAQEKPLVKFSHTAEITSLRFFPVRFLKNYESIKARVIERGQKLCDLDGFHCKMLIDPRDPRKNSRVMVDNRGPLDKKCDRLDPLPFVADLRQFSDMISQSPAQMTPAEGHKPLKAVKLMDGSTQVDTDDTPLKRPPRDKRPDRVASKGQSDDPRDQQPSGSLTDFWLQICKPYATIFNLKDKTWSVDHLDNIQDIEWDEDPFESLVLPDGYKRLILAFVTSQVKYDSVFGDVIHGKGGGLVVLLSGMPGIGKTLTAEAVAEKLHLPLLKLALDKVQAGTEDFQRMFKAAARWKAVLLVDECDTYLEARSSETKSRNEVVNKFLHEVEYCPTLIFMTTNRESVIDKAVKSRAHLTINYPTLDHASRRQIWSNFLSRSLDSAVSDEQLDRIADVEVDGRRIRNVVKTAGILANQEGRALSFEDIKEVFRVTERITI